MRWHFSAPGVWKGKGSTPYGPSTSNSSGAAKVARMPRAAPIPKILPITLTKASMPAETPTAQSPNARRSTQPIEKTRAETVSYTHLTLPTKA